MRNEKRFTWKSLRVGVFTLVSLVVLMVLLLNATGNFNPFEKKFRLRAQFTSADGLREGAQVHLAGVQIGKVESVRFLAPERPDAANIEAIFNVSGELDGRPIYERIRGDSTAQLIAANLLGNDKFINITPGTINASPIAENAVLPSTVAVSVNQLTESANGVAVNLNKIAEPLAQVAEKANRGEGTLGKLVNDETLYSNLNATVGEAKLTVMQMQNLVDQARRGNGTAGKLLNDPQLYDNLNRTVAQLDSISKDLRGGRGTAGKLLNDEELYNDARSAIQDVRDTINGAKPSIERLNQITANLESVSKDLSEGRGTAGKFLRDEALYDDVRRTLVKVDSATSRLDSIMSDAQSGKGTIGKLLTDETLYNNVNQTAANVNQLSTEGTKLLYDFRQNPKKYLRIKLSLF